MIDLLDFAFYSFMSMIALCSILYSLERSTFRVYLVFVPAVMIMLVVAELAKAVIIQSL